MDARDEDREHFRRTLEWTMGRVWQTGNRVTVLKNGVQIFPSMMQAIARAERTVDFVTFVWWQGEVARNLARLLADKAREGVRVRMVLDGYGSHPMDPELRHLMESAGVELRIYRPMRRLLQPWRLDNRTHKKILVCDGAVGFTGGAGIASEWEGDADSPKHWRETHLRIEGPAVRGLEGAFLANWAEAGGDATEDIGKIPDAERPGDVEMMTISATAAVGFSDIATLLRSAIAAARRRLRITTAYFAPDTETLRQLKCASERGVEIDILMPGRHHDQPLSQLAGEAVYDHVLGNGIRAWRYQRSMLHAKVLTADETLAIVGSPNFNHRSLLKDDEACVAILDRDIVRILDDHFEEDLTHAERIDRDEWKKRSPFHRIKESIIRHVLAPQL